MKIHKKKLRDHTNNELAENPQPSFSFTNEKITDMSHDLHVAKNIYTWYKDKKIVER